MNRSFRCAEGRTVHAMERYEPFTTGPTRHERFTP
jgi:hypothetical protein